LQFENETSIFRLYYHGLVVLVPWRGTIATKAW